MTAIQILQLITAADAALAQSVALYRSVRDTLSSQDVAAVDAKLASLQSANDAAFIRVDADLGKAAG
jgi:hypothetical protein